MGEGSRGEPATCPSPRQPLKGRCRPGAGAVRLVRARLRHPGLHTPLPASGCGPSKHPTATAPEHPSVCPFMASRSRHGVTWAVGHHSSHPLAHPAPRPGPRPHSRIWLELGKSNSNGMRSKFHFPITLTPFQVVVGRCVGQSSYRRSTVVPRPTGWPVAHLSLCLPPRLDVVLSEFLCPHLVRLQPGLSITCAVRPLPDKQASCSLPPLLPSHLVCPARWPRIFTKFLGLPLHGRRISATPAPSTALVSEAPKLSTVHQVTERMSVTPSSLLAIYSPCLHTSGYGELTPVGRTYFLPYRALAVQKSGLSAAVPGATQNRPALCPQ